MLFISYMTNARMYVAIKGTCYTTNCLMAQASYIQKFNQQHKLQLDTISPVIWCHIRHESDDAGGNYCLLPVRRESYYTTDT